MADIWVTLSSSVEQGVHFLLLQLHKVLGKLKQDEALFVVVFFFFFEI